MFKKWQNIDYCTKRMHCTRLLLKTPGRLKAWWQFPNVGIFHHFPSIFSSNQSDNAVYMSCQILSNFAILGNSKIMMMKKRFLRSCLLCWNSSSNIWQMQSEDYLLQAEQVNSRRKGHIRRFTRSAPQVWGARCWRRNWRTRNR